MKYNVYLSLLGVLNQCVTSGFILGLSTLATDNAPANYIVGIIVFMIALGFATVAAIDAILLIKVV